MGKEWLYWVGGGGNGRSTTKRGRPPPGETQKAAAASVSAGCMCAVFHLFHLHHFPSTQRNNNYLFLQEEATSTSRGVEGLTISRVQWVPTRLIVSRVEAPRNSLELEEKAAMKLDQHLNFPVGIQIKTSKSKSRMDSISTECSSCNSPKTPSLVARLMGLDPLPQPTSPSITSNKSHRNFLDYDVAAAAARSLPETPRVSSSSSRRSDVERHRLSLQINKENIASQDENITRGLVHCTRRSVGLDITNMRRDENLVLIKPTKTRNTKILSKRDSEISHDGKQSNVRILDHNKMTKNSSTISSSFDRGHQTPLMRNQKQIKKGGNGEKCSSSRLNKLPRRAADSDEFIRSRKTNNLNLMEKKLSKRRTSLSCDNILQVKKGPSPPPTKLPQKQVSSASKPSQSYNQRNKILTQPCSSNGGATALHGGAPPRLRKYIYSILKHAGIINQVNTLSKWHSPSHRIDPGVFHYLEVNAATAAVLSHRCNRKLIFELVDELLAKNLTAHFSLRRRRSPHGGCFPLVEELCEKIESFPAARCVVLEDIDALIDRDMCEGLLNGYLGEEEKMVCEIEGEIVEWMVRETVAVMGGDAAETRIFQRGLTTMVV